MRDCESEFVRKDLGETLPVLSNPQIFPIAATIPDLRCFIGGGHSCS